jgi:hypothetical protein
MRRITSPFSVKDANRSPACVRKTDDDLAVLSEGVVRILPSRGAAIVKYGHCFVKADSVLRQIARRFAIIPVEPHGFIDGTRP